MSLNELKLKMDYNTNEDDVVNDFYIPCLQQSSSYDRITGFFSGVALQIIGRGLCSLITNGGRMRLIISTRLSEEDEEAMRQGYEEREIVAKDFLDKFDDPTDEFGKGYLSLLTYLIAHEILDVRVAVVRSSCKTAMEHEKIGIFFDDAGNVVAFSGSGNETPSGLINNSENFDVYCSWKGLDPSNRCFGKQFHFNKLWSSSINNVDTIPFPEAVKAKLFQYQDYLPKEQLILLDKRFRNELVSNKITQDYLPSFGRIILHDYQKNAVEQWQKNSYRGFFDMATGTGKTYTALGCLVALTHDANVKRKRFFCIIVVPFTHLATQWGGDCSTFGIKPLLAFGNSRKWKEKFEDSVNSIELQQSKFECVVITIGSLLHDFVLSGLERIKNNVVFIADEAHNLGAGKTSKVLEIDFKFRLGLSATMDRHRDKVGTSKLYEFFGPCCAHYGLDKAIAEGHLSHYKYYPVLVWLDPDELDGYVKLSREISKLSAYENPDDCESLKMLLLKRALIISGCRMKLPALEESIKPFAKDYHTLVYCGAVSYSDASDPKEDTQIKSVINMLYNGLHMKVERFTSLENIEERTTIKNHFENKVVNALVAIKCLDEGVNIPCIQRAFILASSTNPKEYIQRRGRVLRLFNPTEKPYAEIFDFVTVSRDPKTLSSISSEQLHLESSLAKRELARVEEFSHLADNSSESSQVISEIVSAYGLDEFDPEGDDYE
jgi:superfamily II DNA or RNA helicase